MYKLVKLVALGGVIAVMAQLANAQRPAGPNQAGLITNLSVQEELKLTDEQKEKITHTAKKRWDAVINLKDDSKDLRSEKLRKINEEANKEFTAILKPEQAKRLKQIEFQSDVPNSLITDDVVNELKITDAQKEKLKVIADNSLKDVEAQLGKAKSTGIRKEALEKVTALRKEAVDKALEVLGEEQRNKWKELVGAPFILTTMTKGDRPFELPDWAKAILEKAETFELYSLDPGEGEKPDDNARLYGWKILGKMTLKRGDQTGKNLLAALSQARISRGAKCFDPRHAIHAEHEGKTVDIVICFECHWVHVYSGDKSVVLTIDGPQAVTVFNKVLSDAKIPLPKQRNE